MTHPTAPHIGDHQEPATSPQLPSTKAPDSSVALLREGYLFMSKQFEALDSDVFSTRMMGRKVVCLRGKEAARLFYGGGGLSRQGALPKSALHLLQDEGSVQSLEGDAHENRKQMFMALAGLDVIRDFDHGLDKIWLDTADGWVRGETRQLYPLMNRLLTIAGLRWCGLPEDQETVDRMTGELSAMVDEAGLMGPANWFARARRRQGAESWAAEMIDAVRAEGAAEADSTARTMAQIIAFHEEDRGRLSRDIAAVELLNVLRPIVAISRFIVFAVHAMARHPRWRQEFGSGDYEHLTGFVQEVRRYYPFFPLMGARTTELIDWESHQFPPGTWLLFDIYGSLHDHRIWSSPHSFDPERFTAEPPPFTLVAQGAGDYETSHRCPGEPLTMAAMMTMIKLLSGFPYRLPAQDLSIRLDKLPALPTDGVLLQRM